MRALIPKSNPIEVLLIEGCFIINSSPPFEILRSKSGVFEEKIPNESLKSNVIFLKVLQMLVQT